MDAIDSLDGYPADPRQAKALRAVAETHDSELLFGRRCANIKCNKPLRGAPVIVVTTGHVRQFCHMFCVVEGHEAKLDAIFESAPGGESDGWTAPTLPLRGR